MDDGFVEGLGGTETFGVPRGDFAEHHTAAIFAKNIDHQVIMTAQDADAFFKGRLGKEFAGTKKSFDDEDKYISKLNVIKENYFPKAKADDSDKLEDSVDQGTLTDNTVMSRYVQGISQAAKFDKVKN